MLGKGGVILLGAIRPVKIKKWSQRGECFKKSVGV